MKTKVILLLVFLTLFAVIIIQNNQNIPFRVFLWSFDLPKVILVPLLVGLGFLFAFSVAMAGSRSRKAKPVVTSPKNP